MNVSPPLCEMLADPLLQERYTRHLENLIELANKEEHRTRKEARSFTTSQRCTSRISPHRSISGTTAMTEILINAFRELQDEGVIEIITCWRDARIFAVDLDRESRRAQIQVAVANYKKHFATATRHLAARVRYEPGVEDL